MTKPNDKAEILSTKEIEEISEILDRLETETPTKLKDDPQLGKLVEYFSPTLGRERMDQYIDVCLFHHLDAEIDNLQRAVSRGFSAYNDVSLIFLIQQGSQEFDNFIFGTNFKRGIELMLSDALWDHGARDLPAVLPDAKRVEIIFSASQRFRAYSHRRAMGFYAKREIRRRFGSRLIDQALFDIIAPTTFDEIPVEGLQVRRDKIFSEKLFRPLCGWVEKSLNRGLSEEARGELETAVYYVYADALKEHDDQAPRNLSERWIFDGQVLETLLSSAAEARIASPEHARNIAFIPKAVRDKIKNLEREIRTRRKYFVQSFGRDVSGERSDGNFQAGTARKESDNDEEYSPLKKRTERRKKDIEDERFQAGADEEEPAQAPYPRGPRKHIGLPPEIDPRPRQLTTWIQEEDATAAWILDLVAGGHNYKDIANIVGCSESQVKYSLKKTRDKFKKTFGH
jgi:hypothetical protein